MYRFTIRDVLWLTVVVALSLAWRMDSRARMQQVEEEQDTAGILRTDNAALERQNAKHRATILRLESERLPPKIP